MAQLTLQINNRPYDMACDDGQEDHIRGLADYLNKRLSMIVQSGAAKNENHLLVLTGLVLADEIRELKEQMQNGGTSVTSTEAHIDQKILEKLSVSVGTLAERITLIAKELHDEQKALDKADKKTG